MFITRLFIGWPLLVLLGACASSDVADYQGGTPEAIAGEVQISPNGDSGDDYQIVGPPIEVRAGFGQFATGMLRGGSNFGSSIRLQGERSRADGDSHSIVAQLQYTNLGGVYRRYDRAGIEGIASLAVTTLDMHKQFTPNSVNMTETVAVQIGEAELRQRADAGFTLRLSDDSGNLEELVVPGAYVRGYLLAVDRFHGEAAR